MYFLHSDNFNGGGGVYVAKTIEDFQIIVMNRSYVYYLMKNHVYVCWIVNYIPGPGADSVVTTIACRANVMYQDDIMLS